MLSFSEVLMFIGLVVGFAITPGPNMMLYLTHTFEYGRKAGWLTVAGITSAFVFHVTATVLGLTAILVALPATLDILRYIGIVYLLYLAFTNLRIITWKAADPEKAKKPLYYFYLKGLIVNLLNPGTVLLYFSLIPQFIHPERGHILAQNLQLCGLQMLGSTITNFTAVFLAGFATDGFIKHDKYQKWIRYTMSAAITLFAFRMLLWKR